MDLKEDVLKSNPKHALVPREFIECIIRIGCVKVCTLLSFHTPDNDDADNAVRVAGLGAGARSPRAGRRCESARLLVDNVFLTQTCFRMLRA